MTRSDKIKKTLQQVEEMMSLIYEKLSEGSYIESRQLEMKIAKRNNNFDTQECTVKDHIHVLLPELKTLYDKFLF